MPRVKSPTNRGAIQKDYVVTGVSIPLDLYQRLHVKAAQEERSLAFLIRQSITEYLDRHEAQT